jgi:predicted O-methyltransferase YrrM
VTDAVPEPTPEPLPAPAADPLAHVLADLAAAQTHDHALVELEVAAEATGEHLPDRAAASFVAWAVRAVGATRVVELGGGRGGLSWWLAGAVGEEGQLHVVTDGASAGTVRDRLRRAGRSGQVTVHATDGGDGGASPDHLAVIDGDLDAVVIREVTPRLAEAWAALVGRVRPGGVVVVGEVLADGPPAGRTGAVVRDALEDPELWSSVVPLGDGWLVALKARSDLAGAATDRLW